MRADAHTLGPYNTVVVEMAVMYAYLQQISRESSNVHS